MATQSNDQNNISIPVMPWEVDPAGSDDSGLLKAALNALESEEEETEEQEPPKGRVKQPDPEDEDEEEEDLEDESEETSEKDEKEDDSDDEKDDEEGDTLFVINGREYTAEQLEELDARGLRQSDYTRKTTEVAEKRKAADAVEAEARAAREQYASQLTLLTQAFEQLLPKEPNWEQLQQENPDEFPAVFASYQLRKQQIDALKEHQRSVAEEQKKDREKLIKDHVAKESAKLADAIPAWKDPKVAARETAKLAEFVKSFGYTDADLERVVDHRVMLFAYHAMKHAQLETGKDKIRTKVRNKPVLKPGSRNVTVVSKRGKAKRALSQAKSRLSKSASTDDLAAGIEILLGDVL
jgi:hypothetical protein